MFLSSELKSREFLAKGLPIISGVEIDIFTNMNSPYYLQFPNDASDIDIVDIVNFYDKVYCSSNKVVEVRKAIRCVAEENLSMPSTMSPITDYMKNSVKR